MTATDVYRVRRYVVEIDTSGSNRQFQDNIIGMENTYTSVHMKCLLACGNIV